MFDLLFPKHWSTLKKLIWLKAAALSSAVQKTVTAAIVHIRDALAGPAQNVTIAIEPVQSGSGDPSPDNVRPISGWTGANVYRTGANIWGGEKMIADMYASMQAGTIDADAGTIKYTGPQAASHDGWLSGNVKFKENTRYTIILKFSNSGANLNSFLSIAYTDGTYTSLNSFGPSDGTPVTKAVTSTSGKTIKCIGGANFSGTCTLYTKESGIFEGVLTAADFQPYTGTTIPITFPTPPGTVYGGTLDVTTGELTVDRVAVDLGALSWTKGSTSSGHWRFQVTVSDIKMAPTAASVVNILCSQYKTGSANDTWVGIKCIAINNTTPRIFVCDESYSDAATFKAAMDGVTAVYELEKPQTYQLTAHQIDLLAGENSLWSDTGNTTLTYMADGRADDVQALNILLGGRYVNNGGADEADDREALDILLGR